MQVHPLKISLVIIAVMFSISLTFTIVGLVTFDLSVQEIKKLLGSRNEGFAFNMIQGLDKHIEKRLLDFKDLTKLELIQLALINSNEEFKKIEDVKSYLNIREQDIANTGIFPFIGTAVGEVLIHELEDTVEFYNEEYNYDVIQELFVTNAYGANVALAYGTSDYSQSDEEWWQVTKENGSYKGRVDFNEDYETYSIDFAYRIDDMDGNFIGIMRVMITLDDLLSEFVEESNLLTSSGRSVLLLDETGNSIYSDEIITLSSSPVPYFTKITRGGESGYFQLKGDFDDFSLISYAQSTGYKTFEGFEWIVVIEQDKSSILAEFVELRNSILIASIAGMIASVIGALLISGTVSSPLKQLTKTARSISKGNFDVKVRKSRIDEIQTISSSIEKMANDLEKLVETEKQLAEAHVKIKNERLSAIGELAASMAHDLKNPLATIKSSAIILQKNTKDVELYEVVDRMNRAIERMSHQINDVLNYVRITPLEFEQIKVTDLLYMAKNSLTIPDNVSISIPESDIQIKCDIEKLEIVFINIFLNAIQAIGTDVGKIECSIKQKDSTVIIDVKDSGPGIPDEIFSKIFDPLVSSKQKGTGLGLSTCKNVLEQHGGSISAHNDPTIFTVNLPISPK